MFWTWLVVLLHVLAFVLPLVGVAAVYRRTHRNLGRARELTASVQGVLAWHNAETKLLAAGPGGYHDQESERERIATEYGWRLRDAGVANKTWNDASLALLTDGKSNLVDLANAVDIARSDAWWVIGGLTLGLVANLIPTIWTIPALIT
jgi:hypothetical protein